jgi:uncharacterized protein YjbJ (UPF0337 family)
MATADKAKNTANKAKGKVEEAAGAATNDEKLEAKGRRDQTKSDAKQAGEKVKDTFRR